MGMPWLHCWRIKISRYLNEKLSSGATQVVWLCLLKMIAIFGGTCEGHSVVENIPQFTGSVWAVVFKQRDPLLWTYWIGPIASQAQSQNLTHLLDLVWDSQVTLYWELERRRHKLQSARVVLFSGIIRGAEKFNLNFTDRYFHGMQMSIKRKRKAGSVVMCAKF